MFILWFFIMLIILVLVHELGHFAIAKAFGVTVEEFGIFLPPRIFGIRKGETIYSVNALPLGGFCRMSGEVDAQEVSKIGEEKRVWGKKPVGKDGQPFKTVTLASKSGGKRILILGAGSIMNLILPVFLLMIALMIPHLISTETGDVYVDTVVEGSPAQTAGIKTGDIIENLDGVDLIKSSQYSSIIASNLGKELDITIKHADGKIVSSKITPNSSSTPTSGAVVSSMSPEGGVLVDSVISGSYAQAYGIVDGDRITTFSGTEITSVQQFNELVATNLYTQVELTVVHQNGKTVTISLEPHYTPDLPV
jgi:regulator of sigma E protease